eukprot:CAMPEP_0181173070 /NCGR_PEP_ID=MMETSP1096-20121128/2792_1 /TAXON_ID=156174 ORGANISM="Chrysochromulina ericina, Strain CCMP281" /NCGR_SAMPLE_ID=MMETSP1096 /ASSEMBLY_ACC=CAM_ASM_000453 /LENGTH=74 /DNA_ID=CAMNT_0023260851 /DNA_START=893 /DNA_END=1115 /DNA_ORIENTATION=-
MHHQVMVKVRQYALEVARLALAALHPAEANVLHWEPCSGQELYASIPFERLMKCLTGGGRLVAGGTTSDGVSDE